MPNKRMSPNAYGLSPALLGRWQHQALAEAVLSGVELEEIKRSRKYS